MNQQKQWESKSETRFYAEPSSSIPCNETVPNSSTNQSQRGFSQVYENRNILVPEHKKITQTSPFKSNLVSVSSPDNSSGNSSPVKATDSTVLGNSASARLTDPPPLPPKPKIMPIKPPNWGQNGYNKYKDIKNTSRNQTMFLEQPSSSFV